MKAYGLELPEQATVLELEIYCYFYDQREEQEFDVDYLKLDLSGKRQLGGRLPRIEHFWNIVELLWGYRTINNNGEKTDRNVQMEGTNVLVREEWGDRMIQAQLDYDWVVLAGCASSSKSHSTALKAMVDFTCDPHGSLTIITSTSISGARKRVWKTIHLLWSFHPLKDEIGRMVSSQCQIKGINRAGDPSDDLGIAILAAGSGSADEAYEKLIGLKADRLRLVADELPQLTKMINDAARGNLENGSLLQPFQVVAMGNPNLITDAHGDLAKPKNGWDSVSEADMEWETERGICLRFDAEQSPNFKAGKTLYNWLPTEDAIYKAKKDFGEKSLMYYRQYKAFWFREAETETIYTEREISENFGDQPYNPERDGDIIRQTAISGADPAYTQGGDVFPVVRGRVIETTKKTIIEVLGYEPLQEVAETGETRTRSMIRQMKQICDKHMIHYENFGFDGTGAGIVLGDAIAADWSTLPLDVQFGGSPSEFNAGINDRRPSKEVYRNRVTELWVRSKGMFAEGMIRGVPEKISEQMVRRRWNTTTKSGAGKKLMVETKEIMKKREGYSPDWADAFFVMIEVAVARGLINVVKSERLEKRVSPNWEKVMMSHDIQGDYALETE